MRCVDRPLRVKCLVSATISLAMVLAGVLLFLRSGPSSNAWVAYAPLSDSTFTPGPKPGRLLGGAAALAGLITFGGVLGYWLGRRHGETEASSG